MGWQEIPLPPSYDESHKEQNRLYALEELTFRPATPQPFPSDLPDKPEKERKMWPYYVAAGVLFFLMTIIIIWLSAWIANLKSRLSIVIDPAVQSRQADLVPTTVTATRVQSTTFSTTYFNTSTAVTTATATTVSVNTTFITRTSLSISNNVVTVTAADVTQISAPLGQHTPSPSAVGTGAAGPVTSGCIASGPPIINTEFCMFVDSCNATLATASNICEDLCKTGACNAVLDTGEQGCCGKCGCL